MVNNGQERFFLMLESRRARHLTPRLKDKVSLFCPSRKFLLILSNMISEGPVTLFVVFHTHFFQWGRWVLIFNVKNFKHIQSRRNHKINTLSLNSTVINIVPVFSSPPFSLLQYCKANTSDNVMSCINYIRVFNFSTALLFFFCWPLYIELFTVMKIFWWFLTF